MEEDGLAAVRAASAFSFSAFATDRQKQVDWRKVDATLRNVPPQFADARFDPLSYVLNTLSARDADEQLAEV